MAHGAGENLDFASACNGWNHGYCPGVRFRGRPWRSALIARRVLRCSFCAVAWELKHLRLHLLRRSGQPFVTAAPDEERKDSPRRNLRRLPGYLKTIDLPALSPFPLVAVRLDMETMDLDLAAMEHGYGRPPLRSSRENRSTQRSQPQSTRWFL